MSKKPTLGDVPGIGEKMEEKLREAGVKTPVSLSKADAEKLASKVDGLSVAGAEKIIASAKALIPETPAKVEAKPKKAAAKTKDEKAEPKAKPKKEAKAEVPKPKKTAEKKPAEKKVAEKKPAKEKKVETKPAPKKPKPKKEAEPAFAKREAPYDERLFRIAEAMKKRKPRFRADQAHRWKRVSDRWRKPRGIDSATRAKYKGRIAMVETGYRTPKAVRGLHPSGYVEAMVFRPADLEGLDPDVHAVRIAGAVGMKKRQDILDQAEMKLFKVLNPGAPESV
ncbi:MAG: 50S ribosomal protein L32e, partial [Candidatus Thorarchaeota archaeon]|nr:50S ribosomal protein L32e [Candidatus Thorarchaeota archaeon]